MSIAERLRLAFARRRIQACWRSGRSMNWNDVRLVWAHAKGINLGLIGASGDRTPEYIGLEWATDAADTVSDAELLSALEGPNPTLAGYCLKALEMRRSQLPPQAVEHLRGRSEQVFLRGGCLGAYMSLGEFVDVLKLKKSDAAN